jgi:SNF2 family DNA or RNA helicase
LPAKELDDYQQESRLFLRDRLFALLADAPGVGKTGPSIIAGLDRYDRTGEPVLVTAPAYLLPNWAAEIEAFSPYTPHISLANGTGSASRQNALEADSPFILTSYNNWSARTKVGEKVARDGTIQPIYDWTYPILHERQWGAVLFDEAHRLRGRNAHGTKHVQLMRRATSPNRRTPVYALTGTPIVNNPGDLFPLLQIYDRSYRSYWKFVNEWCTVQETPWAKVVGQLKPGLEDAWQDLLRPFTLRRTLKDVPKLSTLEETHTHYTVDMPASVRKMITTAKKEYILEHEDLGSTEFVRGGGALYSKLRQLATNPPTVSKPKLDLVSELLEDNPGPVVVYSWYKDSAKAAEDRLAKSGRPVTIITGDTPNEKRKELVDAWSGQSNGLLIATIASLKEGISLVAASTVVFIEHSELPADQEQCVARLKRRGQTDIVSVHHVWANGTPDTAIRRAVVDREVGLTKALKSWLSDVSMAR